MKLNVLKNLTYCLYLYGTMLPWNGNDRLTVKFMMKIQLMFLSGWFGPSNTTSAYIACHLYAHPLYPDEVKHCQLLKAFSTITIIFNHRMHRSLHTLAHYSWSDCFFPFFLLSILKSKTILIWLSFWSNLFHSDWAKLQGPFFLIIRCR